MPPVQIVDMREELKAGNRSIFSRELRDAVAQVLEAGQQAILFLNRRGSATYVFCRNCGYTLKCPRCDLALTYHLESSVPGELRCHTCNYIRRMPEKCPECGSQHIRHYGAGTEKVEHELLKIFPQARTLRWDAETTRRKGAHELLMQRFVKHQADILIGTQMLAKGLDLPLVTLVGVVLADVGLNFPDYRTDERAFQLLTQVAGRAGRSPLGGRVIFQTFQPGHAAIRAAAGHDYQAFYNWQLEERRRLNYPPFTRLARIETRSLKSDEAEQAVALLGEKLKHWIEREGLSASSIDGPTPAFFSRLNGYYRWQLLLRSPDPLSVLRHHNLENFRVEIDPPNIL
jgi:primosomal protein N' (replication factor Y)